MVLTVIAREHASVNSTRRTHRIAINDVLPEASDVYSIKFEGVPDGISSINIVIGGSKILGLDKIELHPNIDLFANQDKDFALLMSKSSDQDTNLEFEFDKAYLESMEKFEMADETEDVISDTEQEFYDGNDYAWGRTVRRNARKTGRQVRIVIKDCYIDIPDIAIETRPGDGLDSAVVNVWQQVSLSEDATSYISKLDVRTQGGPGANCLVKNTLKYARNMAVLCHTFQ